MSKGIRKQSIELGLEVIEALRAEGVTLSYADIAAVCGCSWQAIRLIEQQALGKLKRAWKRREAGLPDNPVPERYRLAHAAYDARMSA